MLSGQEELLLMHIRAVLGSSILQNETKIDITLSYSMERNGSAHQKDGSEGPR
jgi:hypothetical protein